MRPIDDGREGTLQKEILAMGYVILAILFIVLVLVLMRIRRRRRA